ncbi:hypothetical protein LINPERHAP1_LOCUS31027 [Linum perenne]
MFGLEPVATPGLSIIARGGLTPWSRPSSFSEEVPLTSRRVYPPLVSLSASSSCPSLLHAFMYTLSRSLKALVLGVAILSESADIHPIHLIGYHLNGYSIQMDGL